MGLTPRPYPRIPHLAPGPGISDDDHLLSNADRERLLADAVRVEEKLDGANVTLWLDVDGRVQVASRGGPGSIDRAGQLGRLRAWAGERASALRDVLIDDRTLYGEWLWLRHGVAYDRLPDLLVALDIAAADGSFRPLPDRDAVLDGTMLIRPPVLA